MSARPRSSRRPAVSAESRFRPTWPAAAPISCSAATPSSWPRRRPARATPTTRSSAHALAKYREQCAGEREQVLAAGGLHILGTERHESRRIDNQLRGRSGRQGDPGSSRFFLSLEDDLLRIFGADRLKGLMGRIGMEDGVPIEHRWISQGDRERAEEGRGAQLRHPQTSARIRRRDEPAARGGLPSTQGTALGRAAQGRHPRDVRRADRGDRQGPRRGRSRARRNGTGRRSRTRFFKQFNFISNFREMPTAARSTIPTT